MKRNEFESVELQWMNLEPVIQSEVRKRNINIVWLVGGGLVAQSFLTLCDPMDCSPPASSVHGISQARILE